MFAGSIVECVTWLFAALCGLAIVARSLTKMRAIRHVGADDVFIWAAFLCFLGQCVTAQLQVQYGLGHGLDEVPLDILLQEMQAQYAKHLLYMPVIALAKLSVVSMLRKFALHRKDRLLLYTFEWFLAAWALTSELVWAFSCRMPEPWNHFHRCISRDGWIDFFEITNSLTELALIMMPTLSIAQMAIPIRQKLLATSFFGARIVIVPVSILVIVYNAEEMDSGPTLSDVPYVICTMVVAALEILAACVLYARPLFKILETGCFTIASQRSTQRDSEPPGSLLFGPEPKGSWPFTRMSSTGDTPTPNGGYTAQVYTDSLDVEKGHAESVEDIHIQRQVDVLSSNVQRACIDDRSPRANPSADFNQHDSDTPPLEGKDPSVPHHSAQHHSDILLWEGEDLSPPPSVQRGQVPTHLRG